MRGGAESRHGRTPTQSSIQGRQRRPAPTTRSQPCTLTPAAGAGRPGHTGAQAGSPGRQPSQQSWAHHCVHVRRSTTGFANMTGWPVEGAATHSRYASGASLTTCRQGRAGRQGAGGTHRWACRGARAGRGAAAARPAREPGAGRTSGRPAASQAPDHGARGVPATAAAHIRAMPAAGAPQSAAPAAAAAPARPPAPPPRRSAPPRAPPAGPRSSHPAAPWHPASAHAPLTRRPGKPR